MYDVDTAQMYNDMAIRTWLTELVRTCGGIEQTIAFLYCSMVIFQKLSSDTTIDSLLRSSIKFLRKEPQSFV